MELLVKFGIFLILVGIGYWRGRRNEREHLKLLDEEEDRLADILTFATRYPDQMSRPMDPILVTGSVVVASDHFRLLLASLRKVVGGNYRAYENLLERGRRHALVRMKQEAKDKGASMIFNVRFATSRISDSRRGEATQVEVLAYGTAFVPAAGSVGDSRVKHQPGEGITLEEPFDLMKNRVTKPWLIAWFALIGYCLFAAIGDRHFTHSWRYAGGAPWEAYGTLATAAAIGLVVLGRKAKVSWAANLILSILTIPALAFTLYFLALQLNGWTAAATAPTPYVLKASLMLAPIAEGPPPLDMVDHREYWQNQPLGTKLDITIVRGWLGFYQYDYHPLRERYEDSYRQHRKRGTKTP